MAGVLAEAGFRIVSGQVPADLRIINTCTVTHRADFEVRAMARRVHRLNPSGKTVITGCLAQLRAEELTELPGVVLIAGQAQKNHLLELLKELTPDAPPVIRVTPPGTDELMGLDYPGFERTRAFFRIQDGCNGCCAYCTIPKARGASRSLDSDLVMEGLKRYAGEGYAEVVLTGIHLGAWGLDLKPAGNLTALLDDIVLSPPPPRIRLSSIEPNEITDRIIDLMRAHPRICPHLHLPLQSGSDRILKAMRRPYRTPLFKELVEKLTAAVPDIALGTDVLVGFPGEDDGAFEETRAFLEGLPLAYFHVFPFSPRPGVEATSMPGRISPKEVKRRAAVLRKMSAEKRGQFHETSLGRVRPTLIENTADKDTGCHTGITDNYIRVLIEGASAAGRIEMVRLDEVLPGGRVLGRLVEGG